MPTSFCPRPRAPPTPPPPPSQHTHPLNLALIKQNWGLQGLHTDFMNTELFLCVCVCVYVCVCFRIIHTWRAEKQTGSYRYKKRSAGKGLESKRYHVRKTIVCKDSRHLSTSKMPCCISYFYSIQSNPDGSNTDGSFTMANSNSFFSPYEILPIAQENKYLRIFYFILSWNCMLCELIRIASSRRF